VVDGVSWRILVEDLQTTYQQLERGEASYHPNDLVQAVVRATAGVCVSGVQQELDYWLAEPRKHVSHLPVDYPGELTQASARIMSVTVLQKPKSLLEVPAAHHTQINDVADALVPFAQWTESAHCSLTWRVTAGGNFVTCRARWAGLHLFSSICF